MTRLPNSAEKKVPSSDNDLAFASIEQTGYLFRQRKLSPVELVKVLLDRIQRINPQLNAFLTVTAEFALEQSREAEKELFTPGVRKARRDRGPLHGIPISLKDNIYTKNVRTTAGSAILRDFVPLHDAFVAADLKEAGAVLLGKTNMHEFAYGVTSNNPHYGPVRNPWNLQCIAGGSSGGSAAAVAAGLCFASIGTDTGGSIRIPSALCGVVGFKPGLDRISAADVIPLSPTLDFVGPIARTTRDTSLLFDELSARAKAERSLRRGKRHQSRRYRLGIPREFFFDRNSPEVETVFRNALRILQKESATLHEIRLPMLEATEDAGNQIAWAEATHYHQQAGWFPARIEEYGEDVRARLEAGTKVSATDYLRALEVRAKFITAFQLAMTSAKIDALVVPTTPIAAPCVGEETTEILGKAHSTRALLLRHNRPANLAGLPAITIPCGFTANGLPVGLQLIGVASAEPLLLAMAAQFEKELPQGCRPPNV